MTEEKTIWYVQGDPESKTFEYKITAEARARELFHNESVSQRYARVFYRIVQEEETMEVRGMKLPKDTTILVKVPPIKPAPRFTRDGVYVFDNLKGSVVAGPYLSIIMTQAEADDRNAKLEEMARRTLAVKIAMTRSLIENELLPAPTSEIEEAVSRAASALNDALQLLEEK